MGNQNIKCDDSKSCKQFRQYISLKYLPTYLQKHKSVPPDFLNQASIIEKNDPLREIYNETFHQMKQNKCFDPEYLALENKEVQRCVASLLGLGICDALGASTEFIPYAPKGLQIIKNGFTDVKNAIDCGLLEPRSGTVGIWTDDCSMALAMATSLIDNKGQFNPKQMRYLFILWIFNGLNNGGRKRSIGLGGNIKISLEEFMHKQTDYCIQGNGFNNGNGSLMRLAPIPIVYRNNIEKAMEISGLSSRTTHNGLESKECCKLLSFILIQLYKRKEGEDGKKIIEQACTNFISQCQSVYYLAHSKQQPLELYEQSCIKFGKKYQLVNQSIEDRNWNWKSPDYMYSKTRFFSQPDYIGSYCMDALAMALHTVWITNSFKEVAIINADLGGDCDTVGAIAGQIAGALYGIDPDMLMLYSEMIDFRKDKYELFLHGLKLTQL